MHLSTCIVGAAFVASTSALALPAPSLASTLLTPRAFTPRDDDPEMTPVTVNDLASGASMDCGSVTFNYDDIYKATQWGTLLQETNKARGAKSKQYPNGRFPHSYDSTDFTFNGDCPADENRQEYPLITDGPYNGGLSNKNWGSHRVVYYREPGEIAPDGNPIVYFCGGITHEGAAAQNLFVQCTVR